MKEFIKHIHQLPQHIVAWILILFGAKKVETLVRPYVVCEVYTYKMKCSCSLGKYVFLSENSLHWYQQGRYTTVYHESGHSRQSIRLGWLYLIVIGLPSAIWNLYQRKHTELDYYKFYTEKWADELGGVER